MAFRSRRTGLSMKPNRLPFSSVKINHPQTKIKNKKNDGDFDFEAEGEAERVERSRGCQVK